MLFGAAALLAPSGAGAQAFGLNEIGTCAVARAGAGTAAPCADGSAIFWNPAAATQLEGIVGYAGAAAVSVSGDFTQDLTRRTFTGEAPLEVPPHLFLNYKVRPTLAAGLGVYVPYGLTSQWGDDFPGRFAAQKASLASVYVQPNVAWAVRPGKLSIGGGPVVGFSTLELRQSLDLSAQRLPTGVTFGQLGVSPLTEFARGVLEGSGTAFGYNLGVQWTPTPDLAVGVRYLSEMRFDYEGDADFTQVETGLVIGGAVPNPANPTGPPAIPAGTPVDALLAPLFAEGGVLADQGVETRIDHPAQLQGGVMYSPNAGRTQLFLDGAYLFWSSFAELPVRFQGTTDFVQPTPLDRELLEDFEDTWSIKGAVDHRFANGWQARAGLSFIESPAPDETVTPLLPDMDRWNIAGGVGIPIGPVVLDLAYLRVETSGRRGRVIERERREQTAVELNSGFYRLDANVFSASLRVRF